MHERWSMKESPWRNANSSMQRSSTRLAHWPRVKQNSVPQKGDQTFALRLFGSTRKLAKYSQALLRLTASSQAITRIRSCQSQIDKSWICRFKETSTNGWWANNKARPEKQDVTKLKAHTTTGGEQSSVYQKCVLRVQTCIIKWSSWTIPRKR